MYLCIHRLFYTAIRFSFRVKKPLVPIIAVGKNRDPVPVMENLPSPKHRYRSAASKALYSLCRLRLECDGTRAETRFRLSAKRTGPFQSAVAPVQSNTGSRSVHISGSNAGCTLFRGSVKSNGYPLHSSFFLSLPLPCVTVCHHISTGLYLMSLRRVKLPMCDSNHSFQSSAEVNSDWCNISTSPWPER
jgi:hypothetical protein